MWRHAYIALRALLACAGAISLYAGLFLKEDSEGRIQNVLEQLWVKIDDREGLAISKGTAFLRAVASVITGKLDQIFGWKIFSPRAIAVSVCYSLASLHLSLFVLALIASVTDSASMDTEDWVMFLLTLGSAALLLFVGTLPVFIRRSGVLKLWFASVPVIAIVYLISLDSFGWFDLGFIFSVRHPSRSQAIAAFVAALVGGVACDIFFIAATRFALKRTSDFHQAPKIVVLVLINLLVACLLVGLPALFVRDPFNLIFAETMQQRIAGTIGLSNSIDVLVSLLFVIVAVVLLTHRLVWPLIGNPVYALQRAGIAGRRGLLVTVGIMLLTVGTGLNLERLEKIVDHLHG